MAVCGGLKRPGAEQFGEMFGRTYGPTSLQIPSARQTEAKRVLTRHCWLATCGGKSLEECCNTTASSVLGFLVAPKAFRRRDQTPLGTLLELHQAESSRTLSAQHSAEETKAGSFASFRAVSSLLYFDFVRPPLHTSSIQLKVKRHLGNIPRFQDSRLLLAVYYKGSL